MPLEPGSRSENILEQGRSLFGILDKVGSGDDLCGLEGLGKFAPFGAQDTAARRPWRRHGFHAEFGRVRAVAVGVAEPYVDGASAEQQSYQEKHGPDDPQPAMANGGPVFLTTDGRLRTASPGGPGCTVVRD